jgi:Tfp pilus assembly protein PilZ
MQKGKVKLIENIMDKRNDKRFTTRLHVKLSSRSIISWGILCDVSENGLFIKANQDFPIGEVIDIEIFMPDNTSCLLTGTVRRRVELPESYRKFGIGVELIRKDATYKHFLKNLDGQTKTPVQTLSTVSNKEV